jgi:hypothetical protein
MLRVPTPALGLLLLCGCDSQYAARQRLTRDNTQVVSEAADVLAGVQDKASAEATAPKLRDIQQRMARLAAQLEALDTEDEIYQSEEKETILAEHSKWMAAQTRLMQEQQRIGAHPELREALGPVWQELTGGMFDPGGVMAAGGETDLGTARQLLPACMPMAPAK